MYSAVTTSSSDDWAIFLEKAFSMPWSLLESEAAICWMSPTLSLISIAYFFASPRFLILYRGDSFEDACNARLAFELEEWGQEKLHSRSLEDK